ncbi:glutamyl-tRNA reductase [Candidatus Poriferisodalis sp.]|uniref:glutamyl-tRNA reductase n=1 Tax=Candidatus Poriferisodalis sp. TaxID=3101277 RepID=UPI003B01BDCA
MSIVVMGVSHRSAPLELLERCTVAAADVPKRLGDLASCENVSEAVVVSTCNRTEAYVLAEKFHAAYGELRDFFCTLSGVAPAVLSDHLYVHYDDAAAHHLFRVASGLESVVLGEHEILGQVRAARDIARDEGTVGAVLNQLFQHGLAAGKRVRSQTGISRGTASVSHAAVSMATDHLGSLETAQVLVVGAGDMAEGMIVALAAAGPATVQVANRTPSHAHALAARVGGHHLPLSRLEDALVEVDLLLTSTGATSVIVDHASVDAVIERRAGRPLLIVDIAVPRDVDPAVARIGGVTLLDMDDLSRFAALGRAGREAEVAAVEAMLVAETARFCDSRSAREMAPVIESLRGRAETVRRVEIERTLAAHPGLGADAREALDRATASLVNKLLHHPTVALKSAAGKSKGDRLADAVRDLFDLWNPSA